MLPIRQIKPKSARTKRILDNKGPQTNENSRTTLFLKYTTTSDILQLCMTDLFALKRPLAQKFNKKNPVRPFEDPASLEFFSDKNDASLMVYGSHSKKRPHALTLARFFGGKVLDMIELMIEPETMRTLAQFKNGKAAVGLKPLVSFSGSAFDDPSNAVYGLAKSILLEMFRGPDVKEVDVEGLQYMICFSVDEAESADAKPMIHLRTYLLRTKKAAGSTLPKVELEEMGPRIDFRVGRHKDADSDMMKEAMRKPKGLPTERPKKNIDTDIIGDKVGRIHLGKQDLGALQTRKMKGLKRSRDVVGAEDVLGGAEEDGGAPLSVGKKMARPRGLLDLPAEIWIKIGREVVKSNEPIELVPNYTDGHYRMRRKQSDGCNSWCEISSPLSTYKLRPSVMACCLLGNVVQPSITRACRLLREELLPIFYANTFIYKTVYRCKSVLLVRWLRDLPRHYALNVFVPDRAWDDRTLRNLDSAGFDIVDPTEVEVGEAGDEGYGGPYEKFRVERRT
ncbi:rRNA-binding ribosome biosynthesis protein rpf2 [Elasticomyces elasticus]|nr:rRNA-binding ribosome biosynthesis protein rpf2 [Elasticomyces elasticus]